MIDKYSVLMSVYIKEKPQFLQESISSMLNQTVLPDEIVIVKDGPLTDELEVVLLNYKNNSLIKVIELNENVGLGKALNFGLNYCRNEFVARMDSDDLSESYRCEKQLNFLSNNDEISVVGSTVIEFLDTKDNVLAYKTSCENHTQIIKKMKFRNPINHPSVMFKKSHVMLSGNYKDWFLNEDYYLWVRMINKGFKFHNLIEPLVCMRVSKQTYERRGGLKYFIHQKRLFDYMLSIGFINIIEYLFNISIRFFVRIIISNNMRKMFYLKILRK
jgi:glycosyltransferase involved in cell wall biosynthesis